MSIIMQNIQLYAQHFAGDSLMQWLIVCDIGGRWAQNNPRKSSSYLNLHQTTRIYTHRLPNTLKIKEIKLNY